MVILGIDPGLTSTGYGLLEARHGIVRYLGSGFIKTHPKETLGKRLEKIYIELESLINETRPGLAVVESIFSFKRNPKAGLLLGMVLGVIYICLGRNRIPILQMSSREIRIAVAGYGGAKKDQIRNAIKRFLNLKDLKSLHASDALACALAFHLRGGRIRNDKISEWKADVHG